MISSRSSSSLTNVVSAKIRPARSHASEQRENNESDREKEREREITGEYGVSALIEDHRPFIKYPQLIQLGAIRQRRRRRIVKRTLVEREASEEIGASARIASR